MTSTVISWLKCVSNHLVACTSWTIPYKSPDRANLFINRMWAMAKLHIGFPEGTATKENVDESNSKLLTQQIRAYWRCYETVRTRPLSDAGGDKSN
ncbi:g_PROTEIN_RECEP_F2_3 domain-containing protein, partial [Caerostris darwini]